MECHENFTRIMGFHENYGFSRELCFSLIYSSFYDNFAVITYSASLKIIKFLLQIDLLLLSYSKILQINEDSLFMTTREGEANGITLEDVTEELLQVS